MGSMESVTASVHQEITRFWCDGSPHSLQEFKAYLEQNSLGDIRNPHISGAIYTARQKGILECISRGIYRAGRELDGNGAAGSGESNDMAYVLKKTQRALSLPVNLMCLSPKERELIPRLQEMYQTCGQLLDELENGGEDDEVSE